MGKVWILLVVAFLSSVALPEKVIARDYNVVSVQEFYDALSPYGRWINDQKCGFVWVPYVSDDFRPYFTDGRWIVTEYGNTWVSSFSWGWACFHYGRWTYNEYYGWMWVPGCEWGPGWVAWRWGSGLCGWAPLSPGITWEGGEYNCPQDWWIFLHARRLYEPRYHNVWRSDYMEGPLHTQNLLQKTAYAGVTYEVNKVSYYAGPYASAVEQLTQQQVQVYRTDSVSTRGADMLRNGRIEIYRLAKTDQVNDRPAPADFVDAPQPIGPPEEVQQSLSQQHTFKANDRKPPVFNHSVINDSPPFFNYPRKQMEDGN